MEIQSHLTKWDWDTCVFGGVDLRRASLHLAQSNSTPLCRTSQHLAQSNSTPCLEKLNTLCRACQQLLKQGGALHCTLAQHKQKTHAVQGGNGLKKVFTLLSNAGCQLLTRLFLVEVSGALHQWLVHIAPSPLWKVLKLLQEDSLQHMRKNMS